VRREIGALRKIQHPNVVKVFWAGKTRDGEWYLITEFLDGESLDEFATGRRSLRDREAVDVALDLLDALVAFHPDAARIKQLEAQRLAGGLTEAESRELTELQSQGLVHRDIKPLNVMLTRTGAKLLDFNIASRVGDPVHTQSGTPPYQPPDAGLDRWDVSTDLFAVGVLLYRLLGNGHHPFPHAMPMAGLPVTDPRTIRPDLDRALAGFLVRACAPASADRFATAAEMRVALREIRAGLLPGLGKRHRYPRASGRICCRSALMSIDVQCSISRPSRSRKMSMNSSSTRFPVGGRSQSSPRCVPRNVLRVATRSRSASWSPISTVASGKACSSAP
jgi:serine/threonine protein kinase